MVPYLIPLAGFSHLKNEQIRKENIFHLDDSGDHDYFDSDVMIMMEICNIFRRCFGTRINNVDHWLVQ